MERISITFLNKTEARQMLPRLFDILYENMNAIAPTGCGYEADKAEFLENVGPALEREERQILLLQVNGHLAGYFQYFINDGLFMVEEIQLLPRYQRTGVFGRLLRFLKTIIPADTQWIEAYAHKNNLHSQSIIHSLGMVCVGENKSGTCLHYRGNLNNLFERF